MLWPPEVSALAFESQLDGLFAARMLLFTAAVPGPRVLTPKPRPPPVVRDTLPATVEYFSVLSAVVPQQFSVYRPAPSLARLPVTVLLRNCISLLLYTPPPSPEEKSAWLFE